MNLYDKRSIRCVECDVPVGEIDFEAKVIRPLCGKCANPLPEGDDKLSYIINSIQNQKLEKPMLA